MSGQDELEAAKTDLIKLIERALRSVPYVRLDRVESITENFERAVECLESNLENDEPVETNRRPQRKHSKKSTEEDKDASNSKYKNAETLLKLRDLLEEADTQSDEEKTKAKERSILVRPLENAQQGGVTKDYSSPSLGSRRLGGPRKPRTQSSRAGQGLNFKNGTKSSSQSNKRKGSTKADIYSDTSSDEEPPPRPPDIKKKGEKKGEKEGEEESEKKPGSFTRDYSSPALGARRLGGKKAAEKQSSRVKSSMSPEASSSSSSEELPTKKGMTGLDRLQNMDREQLSQVPANMDSPKQLRSSLKLLGLASPADGEKSKTPKPGFLRRLDSADSNHAKLEMARTRLMKLLKNMRNNVGYMRMEQYDDVRRLLLEAVEQLEAGTTKAKVALEWAPPEM